jgi:hypothetical protein
LDSVCPLPIPDLFGSASSFPRPPSTSLHSPDADYPPPTFRLLRGGRVVCIGTENQSFSLSGRGRAEIGAVSGTSTLYRFLHRKLYRPATPCRVRTIRLAAQANGARLPAHPSAAWTVEASARVGVDRVLPSNTSALRPVAPCAEMPGWELATLFWVAPTGALPGSSVGLPARRIRPGGGRQPAVDQARWRHLVPRTPPRFSGMANPGGGVAGSWAGGLGEGGVCGEAVATDQV